jgi:signal transduction histidine kinase
MAVRLLAYVPLLVLSAASSAALAAYAWRQRNQPGSRWLALMLAGMTAWAGFYAAGLLTQTLELRLLWLRLNWTGSSIVPACWLLFALSYAGHTEWVTRRVAAAAFAVPAVTVALAWTAGFHDLMWVDPRVVDFGAVTMLRYQDGLWYTVFDVYTYALIGAATTVLLALVLRHRDLYTDQAVALLAGSLFPAVGYLAVLLEFVREGIDVTPLTFPVTGALFAYACFRGSLMDALSPTEAIGEGAAVEAMQDGVVVVNSDGRVIECNPAASTLLDTALVDKHTDDIPVLDSVSLDDQRRTVEHHTPDNRVLEVTVTPIEDVHDRDIGHALVLRDITDRQTAREVLAVTNRVLRHNIRNDLSLVIGHAERVTDHATDDTAIASANEIHDTATELSESARKARLAEGLLDDRRTREPVDVAEIARSAVADARDTHADATISVDTPATATALAVPDIDRAVVELVRNAAKHAGDHPSVDVTVDATEDAVTVAVADDGPGVPSHEQRVVTDATESALEHGTGTGLYLVRWLVEWSGGDLSFADASSRVTLRFDATAE